MSSGLSDRHTHAHTSGQERSTSDSRVLGQSATPRSPHLQLVDLLLPRENPVGVRSGRELLLLLLRRLLTITLLLTIPLLLLGLLELLLIGGLQVVRSALDREGLGVLGVLAELRRVNRRLAPVGVAVLTRVSNRGVALGLLLRGGGLLVVLLLRALVLFLSLLVVLLVHLLLVVLLLPRRGHVAPCRPRTMCEQGGTTHMCEQRRRSKHVVQAKEAQRMGGESRHTRSATEVGAMNGLAM